MWAALVKQGSGALGLCPLSWGCRPKSKAEAEGAQHGAELRWGERDHGPRDEALCICVCPWPTQDHWVSVIDIHFPTGRCFSGGHSNGPGTQ